MEQKAYYEAYDDRYRQVHAQQLQWFGKDPTPIVMEVMERYGITDKSSVLEIGCGEGRDAAFLMKKGYCVFATDVSPEAIRYCREKYGRENYFQVLDCLKDRLPRKRDFIYAVAVLHMLVSQEDRDAFFSFLREQLAPGGIALVCTMGDGETELESDIKTAFQLQQRKHGLSGRILQIAGTSCRVVSFDTLRREIRDNGLTILEEGFTGVEPDFPQMLYAVVRKA